MLGSIYIPNFRKFHQTVWILASFFFLFFFGCFLVKKRPKKAEIQKKKFCSLFFVGKHLHTKFQTTSSNGLDFASFLNFLSILAVIWLITTKKRPKSKKNDLVAFFLLGSIYIPNFRKFHQTAWILPVFLIFGQFWLFFG